MSIAEELEQYLPQAFKRVREELPCRDHSVGNTDFYWEPSDLCKAFFLLLVKDFPQAQLQEYSFRLIKPAYIDPDLLPLAYAIALDGKLFDERGLTNRDDVVQGVIDFYQDKSGSDEDNYTDSFATDTHYELPAEESIEVSRKIIPAEQVRVDAPIMAICARHLPSLLLGQRTLEASAKPAPRRGL